MLRVDLQGAVDVHKRRFRIAGVVGQDREAVKAFEMGGVSRAYLLVERTRLGQLPGLMELGRPLKERCVTHALPGTAEVESVREGWVMAFLGRSMKVAMAVVLQVSRSFVRNLGKMAVDALLPPRCLACGAAVDSSGALCAPCFGGFTFIAAPMCRVCGIPLEVAHDDDLICGGCLRDRPDFNRARAVFVYDATSRGLLLAFKHGDRTDAGVHLARWMRRAGEPLIDACDLIVPVPLHRWRLPWRSYNQAALLANALGKLTGKATVPDALVRTRATASQGHLDRSARRRNVKDAFRVNRPQAIADKKILLIDDVLTTGATVEACTRALLAAGAQAVDVLVLGRVPFHRN
jgi:ComF family protein